MKNNYYTYTTYHQVLQLLMSVLMLLGISEKTASGEQTNHLTTLNRQIAWGIWGNETNGLTGGIDVRPEDHEIVVYIGQTGMTKISVPKSDIETTNSAVPKLPREPGNSDNMFLDIIHNTIPKSPREPGYFDRYSPIYLGTTNGFCGLIELDDVNGKSIQLTEPEVNNLNAYPDYLRWSILDPKMGGVFLNNLRLNTEVYFNSNISQRGMFQLRDYFQIKQSGEYKLTVWPKIYKRSENPDDDRDLYQRIDIPPISVRISL